MAERRRISRWGIRLSVVAATLLIAASAEVQGDSIAIAGTRCCVWLPAEACAFGLAKDKAKDVSLNEAPAAQAIVDAYAQQQDRIQAFTVHYLARYSGRHQLCGQGGNSSAQAERCHDGWFSQDFRQNRHTRHEYQWEPHTKWTRGRAGLMLWQWDGTIYSQYAEKRREGTICRGNDPVARAHTERPLQALCRTFKGKDLMGYPTQDELRIDKRLRGLPLILRPEVETVGTFQCRVVEADTPFGRIVAWFVPGKGHSLVQCTIDKGRDDVYERAHVEFVVNELQEVDGLWLPKSGRAMEDWRMLDGGFITRETTVQLDSFVINPDFDKDGTFDLTKHVADGSTWRYMDAPDIAYRWEKGELIE